MEAFSATFGAPTPRPSRHAPACLPWPTQAACSSTSYASSTFRCGRSSCASGNRQASEDGPSHL